MWNAVMTFFDNIWQVIGTMRYTDVIDIAIVTLIIYKFITFVRKSSSGRVAKGIVLIVALMWLSSQFQLYVINFLLGKVVELGFLALVVLFQPELRKMLEKVGNRTLGGLFRKQSDFRDIEAAIAQTVLACSEMSRTRTGALIIFERKISLDDPVKTGTIVDACVTGELLKNIFYPKAPLHDGAAIVREGRIAAAGCMLPLSTNPNLSRDLGMRHRAGIGMSEMSDAVVAIVSEETGSISVAVEGMLKRHLTPDTFEKLLRNELIQAPPVRRGKAERRSKEKNGEQGNK